MHTWKIYLLPVCDDEFEERKKEKKKTIRHCQEKR